MKKNTHKNTEATLIKELFNADQKDRSPGNHLRKYKDRKRLMIIAKRDKERIRVLRNILASGRPLRGIDYFRAAAIYEHSNEIQNLHQAKRIAKKAIKEGYERGKWLFAIATDKALVLRGKRQKFGTQLCKNSLGRWELLPVQARTSDSERKQFNVLPLKRIMQRISYLNRNPNNSPILKRIGITLGK